MEEQQRNIDEVFRQSLSDYREAPPGAAWQNIVSRLDEEDGRRRGLFLRWPWVALSLLLIVGSAWVVVGLNNRNNDSAKRLSSGNAPAVHERIAQNITSAAALPEIEDQETATAINKEIPKEESAEKPAVENPAPSEPLIAKIAAAPFARPAGAGPVGKNITLQEAGAPRSILVSKPAETENLTANPVVQRQKDVLAAVRAYDYSRAEKAELIIPLSPVAKSLEAERAPVVQPEAKETNPNISQPGSMQRRDVDRVASLEAAKHIEAVKTLKVETPETLPADNSPLPSAAIDAEQRERIPDEQVTILQSKTVFEEKQVTAAKIDKPSPVTIELPKVVSSPVPNSVEQQADNNAVDLPKVKMPHTVTLAVLAGYERSFNAPAINRYDASLRLLWQASRALSIGLQPTFRFGNLPTTTLTASKSYFSSSIEIDSFHTADQSPSVRYKIDSIYNYVVREKYDSIYVSGTNVGGSFWEIELPLLLHYQLNKAWYVYGGPSINLGGKLKFNGASDPQVFTAVRRDSLAQSQQLPAGAFHGYFGKSSLEPYSSYKPAQAPEGPPVRLGYLFGAGYSWNRVLAEASLHQQLSGYSEIAEPLKNVYSGPNLRLSVGYLLFAPKQPVRGIAE